MSFDHKKIQDISMKRSYNDTFDELLTMENLSLSFEEVSFSEEMYTLLI